MEWKGQPALLDEDNLCGITLLNLVSSGSALIAELLRLAANVPAAFVDGTDSDFQDVLFDFGYLRDPESFENRVNSSIRPREGLLETDQECLELHEKFCRRAYNLFASMVKYWRDLDAFLERLAQGYFIQHTADNVLEDVDGKQLLGEAFFLYGAMLILMEARLPGPLRERLVVACYRNQGESALEDVDAVCKLVRATGCDGAKRPKNYPESLFARFRTERTESTARRVIQRLMSDDVYLQSAAFPDPQHRSTRLASQASMLYVILYFDAETLKTRTAAMREVVDKHFADNWILPVYMGHLVDLSLEWKGYGAANAALQNVLTPAAIASHCAANAALVTRCLSDLDTYLTEGHLTEQLLLEDSRPLLDVARRCNVALRWRLLHRTSADAAVAKQTRAAAGAAADAESLMTLLLKTAQLEYRLKQMVATLLEAKAQKWDFCKTQVVQRMTELSEYFTGEKALSRVRRDENLMKWFAALAQEVSGLSEAEGHATVLGRKIQTLIGALSEVEQFDQVDTNLQIKAFLADTREFLLQMVRITNMHHGVLSQLEAIGELAYAWGLLGDYVGILHARVRAEPSTAVLLRALFLKLASILDVPLIRISQCNSADAASVAHYYSAELVAFARRVLDVIPRSVFRVLEAIIAITTHRLAPLPVKLETHFLKDSAQLDERYHLARLTNQLSVFTEGVLAMEKTLLGVIQVEPRKVLHEGLRSELVRQLGRALHEGLVFDDGADVAGVLGTLAKKVDGYRRSVEYVQDYIDVAGLKMWQDELARVVGYAVEQESNRFLKRKVSEAKSKFQSSAVPIPRYAPLRAKGDDALNFMGRTLNALLRLTSPASTSFAPEKAGWFDESRWERCGVKTLQILERAVGVVGLAGLDKLLAFRIVHDLSALVDGYASLVAPQAMFLEQLRDALHPNQHLPSQRNAKLYQGAVRQVEKVMPELLHRIRAVGHAQLLRRAIAHALKFKSQTDANALFLSLANVDSAVLGDVMEHYRSPETVAYPLPDGGAQKPRKLLQDLSRLLDASGLGDPAQKIYVVTQALEGLPTLLLLFVLSYMGKLEYCPRLGTLVKRKLSYPIDGAVLLFGVYTLCKQFHPTYMRQLLDHLCQFICSTLAVVHAEAQKTAPKDPDNSIPVEVLNTIWFVDQLVRLGGLASPTDGLPPHILALLPTHNET
ncbi:WASH complex, subunit strumpellin [Pelagophyceae sp. CCMP2097]|nr:WASH complex, subunit strumpellin [Pelagophyceae sp. CCMP2097]